VDLVFQPQAAVVVVVNKIEVALQAAAVVAEAVAAAEVQAELEVL
jgi:hypothetical protein